MLNYHVEIHYLYLIFEINHIRVKQLVQLTFWLLFYEIA